MRWLAGVAGLVFLVSPAAGDTPASEDAPVADEGAFQDEFDFLEEEASYVESAARRRQPVQLSPSAVFVLTREEIEASGARTLPEVLRVVPNMDVQMLTPFWYNVGVRGGISTMGSDSVMLMVNGRDATLEFLGFPTWTAQALSLDEVKRIEVIRGPGSALYGANAFSGVVSVTTVAPGEGPRASVSLRGGEHAFLELGCRASETFGPAAVAASAGMIRQDYWTQRGEEGFNVLRGRVEGRLELGEDMSILFEGAAYQTHGRGRTGLGEVEFPSLVSGLARARFQLGKLLIQAVYERFDFEADVNMDIELEGRPLVWSPVVQVGVNKFGLVAQHEAEVAHNRIIYGAEYLFHGYRIAVFIPPELNEHRAGVFLQDEVDLAAIVRDLWQTEIPPLYLTAGARFDYNTLPTWELSPRVAIVFLPSEHQTLRVGYAHAFQKPKLIESNLHVHVEHASFVDVDEVRYEPDPDLDNETIDSIEAGYRVDLLERRLQMEIAFAYNIYRDPVTLETIDEKLRYIEIGPLRFLDPSGPGLVVQNDKVGLDGYNLELQLTARPTESSRVFFTAGYRRLFSSRSGIPIDREPILRLAAGLDLRAHRGWQFSLRGFFTDNFRRRIRDTGGYTADMLRLEIPSSFLLNARLARTIQAERFELQVGIEAFNLLGSRHRDFPGVTLYNRSDWTSERHDRRVVLFLQSQFR